MKTNLFSIDRIKLYSKNAIKKSSFSLVVLLLLLMVQQSFSQNSIVGDGFGGNPGYTPTNYAVASYNGYANCNGTLKGWGDNNYYGLGNGTTVSSNTPINILTNVKYFSGGYVMGAIKNDNTLWIWGGIPNYGNLGLIPRQIDTNVKFVSAGESHLTYCKNDGTAWVIGADGVYYSMITPHQVPGISNCVRTGVSNYSGAATSAFLLNDGTVKFLFGSSTLQVIPITNVVDIKGSMDLLFLLKSDGTVWQFDAIHGNLLSQKVFPAGVSIKAISTCDDGYHAFGLSTTGDLYAWIFGTEYISGSGGANSDIPEFVASNVKDIMAGETFSYIVKNDNTFWVTGASKNTGDGTNSILMNLQGTGSYLFAQINPLIAPMNLCAIVSGCNAGTTAPTLSGTAINNSCPSTTVNLNTLVTSSTPSGTSLVWFTNNAHTGTAYATPTAAAAGTYYAFYYDSVNGCYSPATTAVTATITLPPSVPTVASTTQPTCGVPTGTIVINTQSGVEYSVNNGTTYQASPTFTGLAAGSYTIKVRNTSNSSCSTVAASTLTINALPNAPTLSSATTNVCFSTVANLNSLVTSSTPSGYSLVWFTNNAHTGNAYASPTAAVAGMYYAFYYDAINNCFSSTSFAVTVANDSDCDGIVDSIDIDDDNDGILDVQEEPTCYIPIQLDNLTWFDSGITLNPGTYTKPGSPTETITSNFPLGSTGSFCNNQGGFGPNGQTFTNPTSGVKGWFQTLNDYGGTYTFTRVFKVTPGLVTHIKVGMYEVNSGNQPSSISSSIDGHSLGTADRSNSSWSSNEYTNFYDWIPSGSTISLTISFTAPGGCYADEAIFELLQLYQLPANDCGEDLDGDGIPNQFDLDSDGDGCPDAQEASVSSAYLLSGTIVNGVPNVNMLNVPGAIVQGPYGTNGLSSLIETNDTTLATVNYGSTYHNAFSNTISVCRDSDGDGINDLVDLDDDNDGILDNVEAPSCYYTQAEAGKISLVTSQMNWLYNGNKTYLYDNNAATICDFTPNATIVNKELYNITPIISPLVVTAVTFDMNAAALLTSGSTAKLQGYDGTTWIDLSAAQSATVTNGTQTFANTLHPSSAYQGFRLYGVSGTTDYGQCSEIHLVPVSSSYGSVAPKGVCTTDTDGDGIINTLDLDSDGDGCTDSLEAGVSGVLSSGNVVNLATGSATTTTTVSLPNAIAAGPYGANGLANGVETTTESGIVNYSSTYISRAISKFLNSCSDFDGDGIPDLIDIDDDNDGVLDAIEAPSCYYSGDESKVITSISTQLTMYSTYVIGNVSDNNVATITGFNPSQNWVGLDLFNITPTNPMPITGVELDLVNWALSNGASDTFKLQGYNGTTWTDLSSPVSSTTATGTLTISNTLQPNVSYQKYKIIGVNGTCYYGGVSDLRLVPASSYPASKFPKATCTVDTDGDGIINTLDLDSDGDGCSDAKEASATSSTTPNYIFQGPYGTNGFANSLETLVDNGIANYTPTYQYAISSSLNACADTDGDGIGDIVDIDDDNDGVLDTAEQTCTSPTVSKTGVTASMTLVAATGTVQNLLNGTETTDFYYSGGSIVGQTVAQFNFPTSHTLNKLEITTSGGNFFNVGSTVKVQGWNGSTWIDVSSVLTPVTATASTFSTNSSHKFDISTNTNSYTQYRILGVSGAVNGGPWVYEAHFAEILCVDIDTDGDTIPNRLDLDSDADGCSDAKEAGATTSNVTNYVFPGPYGVNGLQNSLETATESGIVNYTLNYANAMNSAVKACVITCPTVTNSASNNVNPTTCTGTNGSIKLCGLAIGVSGYIINYSKNGSAATPLTNQTADASGCVLISNLGAGVYSNIIITHPIYCTTGTIALGPITITAPVGPNIPTVSATQPTCGVATGTIVFTIQAGVEYSIDNGANYQSSNTFAGLVSGTYNLKVRSTTDATCLTAGTSPITINAVPSAPSVPTVASTTQPTCSVTTGTIVFTTQSGVQYSIDNGVTYQASPTFSGLTAGTYILKVRSTTDTTCSTVAASTVTITAVPTTTTPNLTVSGAICNGTTYTVNYTSNGVVTSSSGTVTATAITGIPVGTNALITATTTNGCGSTTTTVTSPASCTTPPVGCITPTLSAGSGVCSGTGTYSVSVTASSGATITSTAGTVSGNSVIGIPLATAVTITATSGTCTNSVTVASPINCTTPCATTTVSYSLSGCLGTTYTVFISNPNGTTITTSAGTVSETAITNIPIGTNVTLTATATGCTSEIVTLNSPAACIIDAITETTAAINGVTGGTTSSLTTNDTLNGIPVVIGYSPGNVIVTPVNFPTGLTLNTATGQVTVAANTPAGNYPVVYSICDVNNISVCDTVTSYIVVLVADFTPTIDIDNVVFLSTGVSRDFVVNISNIESGPSVEQVVFKIFKQSAFTITYSPSTTTSNVGGGTVVNNSDWLITENTSFITITLKQNVIINASTFSSVGFTISRKANIPSQTWQPITATIVNGSGSDSLDDNNAYNILVKAQ